MNKNTLKKLTSNCYIYGINDEITTETHIGLPDKFRTKIVLSNKKFKFSWNLTLNWNRRYEKLPLDNYLQGTKDRGFYCFWIKNKDIFFPHYLGSGNLSTRIKDGYNKFFPDIQYLYISFYKDNDISKKDMKNLEKEYINFLSPIENKLQYFFKILSGIIFKFLLYAISSYSKYLKYRPFIIHSKKVS